MKKEAENLVKQWSPQKPSKDLVKEARQIVQMGEAKGLLKEVRKLNTFQKTDVVHAIKGHVQKQDTMDLIELIDAEADIVIGREEATSHIFMLEQLCKMVTELLGKDFFAGVNMVDTLELRKRVGLAKEHLKH